ncbi:MAG: beta-ketoacyl-[acyl-carrier-protein] synthase family protein [Sedimentisphaerales bacterium]|jgi:3-oxoacyl-[acyl-carrier-protein] synthase II|nr:beta-ketoacyl-[acyl-carrier-protein] synthase family protein [Sedimentisphaerales bacterium]
MDDRRVVITGLGAVSPLGLSADAMWKGLLEGRCGIGPITAFDPSGFPCKLAGQVEPYRIQEFLPKAYRKAAKLMSRDIELAVMAADMAMRSSGLVTRAIDPEHVNIDPPRFGINLGAGLISCDLVEIAPAVAASIVDGGFDIHKWGSEGMQLVPPLWLLKYLPNMLACHVSIIHDLQGPSNSITSAEVSGACAVAEGRDVIARGDADVILAGGAEAKVNPMVMMSQCLQGRATTCPPEDAQIACRPFDQAASGSVFGEAAGLMVLEALDHAVGRGARILAEVLGTGESCSASARVPGLEPDGAAVRIAIEKAFEDAGLGPTDIDLIIPHGTAVPYEDQAEAAGIEGAFGVHIERVPVWPTKSLLSNTGAAAAAIDMIAGVYAIVHGMIPAARNLDRPREGCRLQINTRPIARPFRRVLCCCFTFGGQAAAVIIGRPTGG